MSCRQAALKGCQVPAPWWDSPDPSKTQGAQHLYRPPASQGTFTAVYCHQIATWQNGIGVRPLSNVQVKVEAAADANRARAPTAASAAPAEEPATVFRPVHGYTTDDILKDKRFRVGTLQFYVNFFATPK